ncbi:hypothetical protein C1646_672809 [Rhizophagus diaphanus]|nr:hypothetical protein C1646_672809 [Rhizophagus diaphanus] [Rhizophagus sp. MUCL 43196]
MVINQKHSFNSIASEQEVIPNTEKIAQLLETDKQNAEAYSALFSIREVIKNDTKGIHSQYNTLEKRVKRLEKDIRSLKIELGDLDKCVNKETVVDLIHKIVPILINEKSKGSAYSSEFSEDSDSVEIIELKAFRAKYLRALTNILPKSIISESSSSESSSSETSSSSENSSSESSSSSGSSLSESSSSSETNSSESSSSDSDIDEIVNMIKHQRICELLA